jgi:prepilin-type N-terminal cleavage/methylation domain-containing protein
MIIKNIQNNNHGFTLIEVLVSLTIIMLMTTLFLSNYNSGIRSNNLSLGAQQLVSDIRSAQDKAIASTPYNGTTFPAGGWGIYFSTSTPSQYILFADSNGNKVYDAGEADPTKGGMIIPLPNSIVISSINTNNVSHPKTNTLDFNFLPPDPSTIIYDSTGIATSSVAWVTLMNTITKQTAKVTVNILGLIQIN